MTTEVSMQERYVLAVEALEREVNNGGYAQFFANSSNEYVDIVVDAIDAIGCSRTALITRRALEVLGLEETPTPGVVAAVIDTAEDELLASLNECDIEYFSSGDAIEVRLLEWIGVKQELISIGDAEQALPANGRKRLAWWKRFGRR